mmetsp:Transcript_20722/g.65155  ORF Transcript_20722/g.65155 Transcript_20722/m.65155 type:complete len:255 (-) Transcript_20722:215-979(-)
MVSMSAKEVSRPPSSSSTSATRLAMRAAAVAEKATRRASTPGAWVVASRERTPRSATASSRSERSWSMPWEMAARVAPVWTVRRTLGGISFFRSAAGTPACRTTNWRRFLQVVSTLVVRVVWSLASAARRTPHLLPCSEPWLTKLVMERTTHMIFLSAVESATQRAAASKFRIWPVISAAWSRTVATSQSARTLARGRRARSINPTMRSESPSSSICASLTRVETEALVALARTPACSAACSMLASSSLRWTRL